MVDAADLKSVNCEFKSHSGFLFRRYSLIGKTTSFGLVVIGSSPVISKKKLNLY